MEYGEENIIHLDDMEHIRRRPGMYIGKLGKRVLTTRSMSSAWVKEK